jgi:hypothetical protein
VFGGVLRYANHPEELILHDPQEIQRPRHLAAHQKVRVEQKPVDKAVAQNPDLLRLVTIQGRADDLLQPTRQLPGAVQNERGFG